jgi:hypothetical protein
MVKKKVSKKNISHTHKTKKPAIKKAEIPVIQEVVSPEIKTFEPPVQKINIEPSASILKEMEIKPEEKIEVKESPIHHESNILKIIGIGLCVLIFLFWLGLAILSTEINSGPKLVEKNVSVTTFNITTVSFNRFNNITDIKYTERVNQLGYLREELNDKGITKKYLVDDRGRKIELMLRGISQGAQYDELFVMEDTSKQLYDVTGIYRFEINRFFIEVDSITTAEKKMTQNIIWRMENITTDDVAGITFSIARGVNKIVTLNYTG